jgi:hypothetical protein
MRSILTIAAIISIGGLMAASGSAAQEDSGYSGNPALAAYLRYRDSAAEYRKCLTDNPANKDACEDQRLTMDNNLQVWSEFPEYKNRIQLNLGAPRR